MKPVILIYGAGAIGRGYVPWVFDPEQYTLRFVEKDPELRSQLKARGKFTSYCTRSGRYVRRVVTADKVYAPGEEKSDMEQFNAIVTAVGPRNVIDMISTIEMSRCPIVLFENDDALADVLQRMLPNHVVCFGVPDVITSNTAPVDLLATDPLSVVTEDGVCFIDDRAASIGGNCRYVSKAELRIQWLAKLFVHNTPHCIAAYLGALSNKIYLHEGMQSPAIYQIVQGAMQEMRDMLITRF